MVTSDDDPCVQDCVCQPQFPPGCSCDPFSADPDSSCPRGQTCRQCQCLQEGCDCDENSPNPDELCPTNFKCKNCKCLAPGCDCDPNAPNPDDFCPANQECKNCKCLEKGNTTTPMSDCVIILCPSGCDCDENLPNADDFCPNNYKCKQCQCLPAGEHQLTNQRSGHPADVQSKTGACHLRITNTVTQPPSCQVIHQASCVACQNHSQKDFSCKPKHTTGIRPL